MPRYAHHACGFVRNRRREQAITQQRCINWRLQHAGLGHVTVLYDVKNAFPSPSHSSLDAAIHAHARPADVGLLVQRHREAFILLRDPFQPAYTLLQVGCGNMQGDRMAPAQFLSVYLPAVEQWHAACQALPHGTALLATDPVSGERCDTSLSTFADDVAKTHAIPTAPEFAPIVTRMDTDLDRSLQALGMAQNHDKKELLVRVMGPGSQKAMQDIYHARTTARGQFRRVAKYLGGWLHHSCATSPEISKRIAAAKRSWSVLRGFWFRRDAPRAQRQLVFKAMVLSAMYSGLDAVPSHKSDDKRLTRLLASLSRKLLQGCACTKPWHDVRGHHRSWTNVQVFQAVGLLASAAERCVRRLLWWQNIVKRPEENVALLASLFGQFPWEGYAQLGPDGRLTQHANPWIRQLVEDLRELCRFALPAPGLIHDQPLLLFHPPHQTVFLSLQIRRLFTQAPAALEELHVDGSQPSGDRASDSDAADAVAPARQFPCGYVGPGGVACPYVARSAVALSTHRHRAHGILVMARQVVVCNQCPWCRKVFASIETARRHVHARAIKGICPRSGGGATSHLES